MNLCTIAQVLGCLAGLLGLPLVALAQQPLPATDVLLLVTGQEVSGRVLTITPTELTYLPAQPDSAALPDTMRLPAVSVLLVRYANGTREVLRRPAPPLPDSTPPTLRGLSAPQRRQLGQADAHRCYRNSGPFWGTLGSTLYLGPLFGLAPAIGISSVTVRDRNLAVPATPLLQDASYAKGYREQANRTKRRRTWAGYGLATALYVALFAALVTSGQ